MGIAGPQCGMLWCGQVARAQGTLRAKLFRFFLLAHHTLHGSLRVNPVPCRAKCRPASAWPSARRTMGRTPAVRVGERLRFSFRFRLLADCFGAAVSLSLTLQ